MRRIYIYAIPILVILIAAIYGSFALAPIEAPQETAMVEPADTASSSAPVSLSPLIRDATSTIPTIADQTDDRPAIKPAATSALILIDVPFTSQAPDADWRDPRHQDGCEEASVVMALAWIAGEKLDPATAKRKILALADWQTENYGSFVDTSAADTVRRLFEEYAGATGARVLASATPELIITELAAGHLVLAPAQGQRLDNPNFTRPGPERHMLVIRGYDPETGEFITNDPGTRNGRGYRYQSGVLARAILDYPTGDHEPITEERKNVIVVEK